MACDVAARHAAKTTGVPIAVLLAITRTETGRTRNGALEPWPWTVNMQGTGRWFDSETRARVYVEKHIEGGARSFDVGCFQLNYRWHGANFASIEEMFEPKANALYAARFLKKLFTETGDWSRAAGAYHSRTPKYADRYIARFDRIRDAITPHGLAGSTAPRLAVVAGKANTFPLLQAGNGQVALGSLVPAHDTQSGALIEFDSDRKGI